mgnify:CR=1 FL=1|tara:strand:+ start:178 stop:732 length:555 start_codon:yes stop_codon:yes gene_type:complete
MGKKTKKESSLYYFYSVGCAYCNKVEPIVDELNSNGYDIIKLDTSDSSNRLFKEEVEMKFHLRCGTPLLVDSETGNAVCGWRGEKNIKKWADGETIPQPPKPKSDAPVLPQDWNNQEQVDKFKEEYEKWKEENKHIPGLQTSEEIIEKFKNHMELQKQQKESFEGRIISIEQKLDKLIKHLGVK